MDKSFEPANQIKENKMAHTINCKQCGHEVIPTKQQVFKAFSNTIEYEYNISDEVEVLMLDAIQVHKKETGIDCLHKVMNDTTWKKIVRSLAF